MSKKQTEQFDDQNAADYAASGAENWDNVQAPIPLPLNVRFKWQLFAAGYKKAAPDDETANSVHWFLFRPIAPVSQVELEALPPDWKSRRIGQRFEVPGYASDYDAKLFYEQTLGISTAGLNFEQAAAAAKKAHPIIEAEAKRRTWTDEQTGMAKWAEGLKKWGPVKIGGDAPAAATTAASYQE